MNRLLESIFGLQAGERLTVFLMALYNYLLLITFYLLKPVRDSLFLAEQGAAELPFVFMLTTAVIIPVAGLHTRASRAYDLGRLINGVSVFLVANIVVLRGLVTLDAAWVSYALYTWVSIYGVLVTSQFWLFANAVFSPSQSKRVFTVLSLGAILGAITGGEVTGLLVEEVGMRSRNLLWLAGACLVGSVGLVNYIRRRHTAWEEEGDPAEPETGELGLKTAFNALQSPHLWVIIGVTALTVITTTVVDFQFKTLAHRAYPSEEALATFMGRFYGRVSMVALFVQFAIAPYLLRVFGIGGALSFLPAMLVVGTLGLLFAPGLVAATLLRGSEQSLKHSIDRTGRELLFVPVDLERKKRAKVFIDLFVDQGMQGFGGLVLLILTVAVGLDVYELSFVVLLLVGGWALLAYRARHSYTDQFRRQLREQNDSDPRSDEDTDQALPDELVRLIDALCSRGEQAARAALDELEAGTSTVPVVALRHVLDHQSPRVRAQAIRVLRKRSVAGLSETVAPYLRDLDPDVQLEAARYLYRDLTGDRIDLLERGLTHQDPRVRSATVALIAKEGGPTEQSLVDEKVLRDLIDMEGEGASERRVQVARLLGVIKGSYRNELLRRLLRDDDPDVVRQAIASAGQTGDRVFVFALLRRLTEPAFESEARTALAQYGARIIGTLYDQLIDKNVDLAIRCQIPHILAVQPRQETVQVLLLSLDSVAIPVRHTVIQALSRLQAQEQDISFASSVIERAFRFEARHYVALGQIMHLHRKAARGDETPHTGRPPEALAALRDECLERVFRLLGLRYDQRDIYDAYLGITSEDRLLRSSAVEFVDNLVDWKTSRLILEFLDDASGLQAVTLGPQRHDLHLHNGVKARTYMLKVDDPRLNALALEAMEKEVTPRLQAMREAAGNYAAAPEEESSGSGGAVDSEAKR